MTDQRWIGPETSAERVFDAYVPRGVLHHLAREPFDPVRSVDGTMLFADLSGFTALSEKLQRRGPEGAELLVVTINGVFDQLLRIAYDNGGSLIKFGGDALLIFFDREQHAARAARAAYLMRERLRTVGRLDVEGVRGVLRMTVGLHSDLFHFVLAGESHLEHLVLGSGARGIVETEGLAENGQITVSAATAALLPDPRSVRAAGEALLLRRLPLDVDLDPPEVIPRPPNEVVGRALSTAVRAHITGGRAAPEHRRACVAFLQFKGTNALIAEEGIDAAAAAVHELVTEVQAAADAWEVCFLDSDVDADGGKLLLTAGAPRVVGDDEERMLLTLRQIIDGKRRLPIRIGVNRGPVFTGEIGPYYRRSYIVMGDTTNLAARTMGKSRLGAIWATPGILERSTTKFLTEKLEPFAAKGKAKLVQAYEVGEARRSATVARGARAVLPLVGRDREAELLREAVAGLAPGKGRAVSLSGDAGTGKSRLLDEAHRIAAGVFQVAASCEAHTAATPYAPWQYLLPALAGLPVDDPDAAYEAARQRCAESAPGLLPWAPLIADVLGAETEPTPEVAALAPEYRAGRLHQVVARFLNPQWPRPTVFTIENAHHLDEASRALLDVLIARVREVPWLVLVAGRDLPDDGSERIELGPLEPSMARELAELATEEHPLAPHVLAEAVTRSGGNPQFLLDLVDAAGGGLAELPDSAQAASMAIIDALPPSDRALVRRLSVFGSSFYPAQLAAVGLTPEGPEGWDPVWRRLSAILEANPGGRRSFRRTTVQEAAYAGLPFGERRRLHAELAAALAAEEAPDPAVLARHYLMAGQEAEAMPYALAAADRSLASGAPADAARLYRSALHAALASGAAGPELASIYDSLGVAQRRAGESRAADETYREARAHAAGDPIRQAELYFRQARLAHRDGRYAASVRWGRAGRRGLADVQSPAASAWRARLTSNEGADRLRQGKPEAAIKLFHAALAEAADGAPPVAERATAHASYLLDWSLVEVGRPEEARYSPRAQEIYARLGDLEDLGNVVNNLGMFAYWEGRWDDAVRYYQEAVDLSERIGDVMGVSFGEGNIGETLADQGRWAEGEEYLIRSLRARRSVGLEAGGGFTRMLLGRLYARSGRTDEGIALLETAAAELAHDSLDLTDSLFAQCYLAEAASYGGQRERTFAEVERLTPTAPARLRALLIRARALVLADPRARVDALEQSIEVARREHCDHDVAVALDALCRLVPDRAEVWQPELDELCRRLGIVGFPELPSTD